MAESVRARQGRPGTAAGSRQSKGPPVSCRVQMVNVTYVWLRVLHMQFCYYYYNVTNDFGAG